MKKKLLISLASVFCLAFALLGTGCMSKSSFLHQLATEKFKNSVDKPISQTDIRGIMERHIQSGEGKKGLLITLDGFRANAISQFAECGKGIARMANEGGLYFTQPSNIEGKSAVGMGTNMLSVLTGMSPDEMGVLKATDGKREEFPSILESSSKECRVRFLTDNEGYIDTQLNQELPKDKTKKSNYTYDYIENFCDMERAILTSLSENKLVVVSLSLPYVAADGDYAMSNEHYLSAIFNINDMIEGVLQELESHPIKYADCLFLATSTFGGEESIFDKKNVHNTTTFLASNQQLDI